jgi:transcriptional regulator with XRE-family HTH domain
MRMCGIQLLQKCACVHNERMSDSLLEKYLKKNDDESQAHFAARAGVSQSALSAWLRGTRTPDIASAVAVEEATGGAVSVASWAHRDRRRKQAKRQRSTVLPKQAG